MTPQRLGKNRTSVMRPAARRGAATDKVTVSGVARQEVFHGLGAGTARRARSMAGAVTAAGGLVALTGSVKATSASSGMQIFSQTSHAARPRRVTTVPTG